MSIFRIERSSDDHAVYSGFNVRDPPNYKCPIIQDIHAIVSGLEPQLRRLEKRMRGLSYKESEVKYVQKWDQVLEDNDHCFYFPHLKSNYILRTDNCILLWYHESLGKLPETEGYLKHDFFAGELVRVGEPTVLILHTIESLFRMNAKRKNEMHLIYSLKIYLEDLTRKQTDETGLKYVQIHTCPQKRVREIFRTLCGNRLKWNYSLSSIDGFPPGDLTNKGQISKPDSWMEQELMEGFETAGGYFQLGSTWWYDWHRDSEDIFIDSSNWVAVFEADIRLMCSPFWPAGSDCRDSTGLMKDVSLEG